MLRKLLILTVLTLLALCGFAFAQDTATESDRPAIAILEFRTYELGWARYRNVDSAGNPKLAAEAGTTFPFIRFNNGYERIRMSDLESADAIADLIAFHDIAWDEDAIAGRCDPNKLAPGSSDIFCVPGTRGMAHGQIFLALFDAESGALLAITTSIDNKAGGALRESWKPTPEPAPEATPEPATGCGPYAPGQWLSAMDHDVSGFGIPIVGAGENVESYQCLVAEDGGAYFQAHNGQSGAGGGKSASAGSGGGTGSGSGSPSGQASGASGYRGAGERSDTGGDKSEIIDVTEEPETCDNPLGCNDKPIME